MKNLACGVVAVLLLASSNASYPTEPQKPPTGRVQIGVIDGSKEYCALHLVNTLPQRWKVQLLCSTSYEGTDAAIMKVRAAAIWLLLDGGKAAVPITPVGKDPLLGVAACTIGCTTGLTVEFEVPGDDPVAVTVRYEGKFHVFPITEEHRLQALDY